MQAFLCHHGQAKTIIMYYFSRCFYRKILDVPNTVLSQKDTGCSKKNIQHLCKKSTFKMYRLLFI